MSLSFEKQQAQQKTWWFENGWLFWKGLWDVFLDSFRFQPFVFRPQLSSTKKSTSFFTHLSCQRFVGKMRRHFGPSNLISFVSVGIFPWLHTNEIWRCPVGSQKMTGFPTSSRLVAYSCFQDFLSHVKGKSKFPCDADIDIIYNVINVFSQK